MKFNDGIEFGNDPNTISYGKLMIGSNNDVIQIDEFSINIDAKCSKYITNSQQN